MTIEVWRLQQKGFVRSFLKTYAVEDKGPSRSYNSSEMSCSNTPGWPSEVFAHINADMEPPEDYTVEAYRKTLVKKCLNAPSDPEDLFFCVKNGKQDFSRVDFFSPMQVARAADYNLLACTNINKAYLEVMRSLSGVVSLPPVDQPPTCEVYGRAALLFKEDAEKRVEGPVTEKKEPFVPYHGAAQTCHSAKADTRERVAACAQIFGITYWLEAMNRNCVKYAGEHGDKQYMQSLENQMNSLQATFGDKALSHGGNQYGGLSFRHGLEYEAFDWFKTVLASEPCPGVVYVTEEPATPEEAAPAEDPAARRQR